MVGPGQSFSHRLKSALTNATLSALVAFALFCLILGLRTVDTVQGLTLKPRPLLLAVAVGIVFAGRLALELFWWNRAWTLPKTWTLPKPIGLKGLGGGVAQYGGIALIIAAALFPIVALALDKALHLGLPLRYLFDLAIVVLTYVMLASGLNIVVGLAGLLDLGYVAFYAVGAYSFALLATNFGWSFWMCLPIAGIFAAMWGATVGLPVLRLRGDYLAIVTLAFAEIVRIVLLNWTELTNGPNGVSGIPKPTFFGLPFSAGDETFSGFFDIKHHPIHAIVFLYYVIFALALLTNLVTLRLRRLPIGRAWEAMREDEIACRSLGINTTVTKLSAFATGAMFGGFAGAFFATRQGFISPELFTFIEFRDDTRHRRARGPREPAWRCTGIDRVDRRLRSAASYPGAGGHFRSELRPRALPDASVRARHGHHHAVAPAWNRVIANAFDLPRAATRRSADEGAPRMSGWQKDPVLKVEHLTMRFGGLTAVDDVSFEAGRHDITALIGPNGAGKTTVFNCITGFYKPTEGMITLTHPDGASFYLERLDDHDTNSRARVARTFQNIRLFKGMTVLENLMVAQHQTLNRASGLTLGALIGIGGYRAAEQQAIAFAREWLRRAGLTSRADTVAGALPYGDQRRLEIARAMCTRPLLLCLDEPAAGLNARESEGLNELLYSIRKQDDIAILLIEHDMSVVMRISDHVVVLDYGKKIADGTAEAVRNDPRVIAAYLGVPEKELAKVGREVGL